jgi:hypothetical protein
MCPCSSGIGRSDGVPANGSQNTGLTEDVDLLVEITPENEAKVIQSLLILPDRAAAELKPGEIGQYGVVRVGVNGVAVAISTQISRPRLLPGPKSTANPR